MENDMRSPEQLKRVAFKEALTVEEDDMLADLFVQRAAGEIVAQKKRSALKQAAFFASRAFDKGARDPDRIGKYVKLLTDVQRVAPSDSFRRKLAEMKWAPAGKDSHSEILKKLSRHGEAFDKDVLATDDELDEIESSLGLTLPPSYREYLEKYAHRQIGTYEPYTAGELESAAREAWSAELETHYVPFLEDNADRFCFDMRSKVKEPPVIFRPHDGTSTETWPNFWAWVEECWLGELDE
jgi:hypothetical protein